ncbi:MAG: hypothetical protein WCF24_11295 [Acidimicrobiales bacterium]
MTSLDLQLGIVQESVPPDVYYDAFPTGSDVQLVVFGLSYQCWRCHEISTPIVALLQRFGGRVFDDDLVVADDEVMRRLAWGLVPETARSFFRVGEVKPRYSTTLGKEYLSNGCASCDALFGDHFLIVESLPEVLATEGIAGLIPLAASSLHESAWNLALFAHFSNRVGPDCC